MSVIGKAVEIAARYLPDAAPDPLLKSHGYIGQPRDRVDGPLKVTGAARFTAEYAADNLAHAALVCSQIATGRVAAIDTTAAEAAPGVVMVITHTNAPRMTAPDMFDTQTGKGSAPSDLPILQDDRVHWNGQPVAVVVANTLEQAAQAASLIIVEYAADRSRVSFDALKSTAVVPKDILGEPPEITIGHPDTALAGAFARVDEVYRTPWYNHNAIEPHATMATWSDKADTLTVYDSTQCLKRFSASFERVFGLASGAVTVVAPFVGGGFGGKAALWHHSVICAAAARLAGRPVRLSLTRE
jgi:xanthine dehydrogenase YagR molybdenum-binding subunit